MARFVSTNQTTGVVSTVSENIVIADGVTVIGTEAVYINHDLPASLYVNGDLIGTDDNNAVGVQIGVTSSETSEIDVFIGADANVQSSSYGFQIRRSFVSVENAGVIQADSTAFEIRGESRGFTLKNTGSITGSNLVDMDGDNLRTGTLRIYNTGEMISVGSFGLIFNHNIKLQNSGTVMSFGTGLNTFSGDFFASNTGTIIADGVALSTPTDTPTVLNTGTIVGALHFGFAGAATIRNTGDIRGQITTGADNDLIINDGLVQGDIDLGRGNDIFRGLNGALTGELNGDAGDDLFLLGTGGGTVEGGGGADAVRSLGSVTANGGLEEIFLLGSEGINAVGDWADNRMIGNAGANFMNGSSGNDVIVGRGGDDELVGGANEDFLFGGAGDDLLTGSSGKDRLFGGSGADIFEFLFFTDSGSTGAGADVIRDFRQGEDAIDVSNLDGNGVLLISGAFSGGGQAELRLAVTGAGNTNIQIDADGDGSVDMLIVAIGQTDLTADDFIL